MNEKRGCSLDCCSSGNMVVYSRERLVGIPQGKNMGSPGYLKGRGIGECLHDGEEEEKVRVMRL